MEKRVLIVDDSVFVHEEIKYMLEGTKYRVIGQAKDGAQAMRLYEELNPDIVTMDIIMPGINGLDTSKLMLDRWNDAKIVIVSSLAYDETNDKAMEAGVCGFVFKPLEKEEFLGALDAAAAAIDAGENPEESAEETEAEEKSGTAAEPSGEEAAAESEE